MYAFISLEARCFELIVLVVILVHVIDVHAVSLMF